MASTAGTGSHRNEINTNSLTSSSFSISSGSVRSLYAIICVFSTGATPPSPTSVVRGTSGEWTEAINLRKDITIKFGIYTRCRIFVYYKLSGLGGSPSTVVVQLSGTAQLASLGVLQVNDSYQGGAPFQIVTDNKINVTRTPAPTYESKFLTRADELSILFNSVFFNRNTGSGSPEGDASEINFNLRASSLGITGFAGFSYFRGDGEGDEFSVNQSGTWSGTNLTTADTFTVGIEVKDIDWTPAEVVISNFNICDYVSKGEIRKMVDSVSGLDHLEGETIKIQMDGDVPRNSTGREVANSFLVSSGTINLPKKAAVVHAGLPYEGKLVFLPIGSGSSRGTGHSKMRRVFSLILRLFRTLGLEVGIDEDHMDPIFSSSKKDLFTGNQKKLPNTAWREDTEIVIKQTKPLPAFITAAIIRSEVEEKL